MANFRQLVVCGGVVLVAVMGLLLWGGSSRAEAKPGVPLAVSWHWATNKNADGARQLTLTVAARVAMRHAAVRFGIDGGSGLVSGPISWQGSMVAGEIVTRRLWVQPPADRGLKAFIEGITVSDVHVYQVLTLNETVIPTAETRQKTRAAETFGFTDAPAGSGGLRELPGR